MNLESSYQRLDSIFKCTVLGVENCSDFRNLK